MLVAPAAGDAAGWRSDGSAQGGAPGPCALDLTLLLPSGPVARVCSTTAAHGDFAIDQPPAAVATRRQALVPLPWTWLRQVHGADLVTVGAPGEHAGAEADAAATAVRGAALAVQTADCAPVALIADHGMVAAIHAGWRGLAGGVIERAAAVLRAGGGGRGADRLRAVIGPCIGPCCYEFGPDDLDRLAGRYGDGVRATARSGRPALDVPTAVAAAVRGVGAEVVAASTTCTACGSPAMFSHRARGDTARQTTVVWLDRALDPGEGSGGPNHGHGAVLGPQGRSVLGVPKVRG